MSSETDLADDIAVALEPYRAIDELRSRLGRRKVDKYTHRVRQPLVEELRHFAVELDDDPYGIWQNQPPDGAHRHHARNTRTVRARGLERHGRRLRRTVAIQPRRRRRRLVRRDQTLRTRR